MADFDDMEGARGSDLAAVALEDEDDISDDDEPLDTHGKLAYLAKCDELGLIPVSQVLKYLEQEEMQITHYGLGQAGVQALAEALLANSSVTTLRVGDNNLQPAGAACLCEALVQKNPNPVVELDLAENGVGEKGIAALTRLFEPKASKLTTVCLRGNKLQDREAKLLAEKLSGNTTVTYLDLSVNLFSERAGRALGQLLEENGFLKELNLAWNNLRGKGAAALAAGLKLNAALEVLNVGWNGLGAEGAAAVGDGVATNVGIVEIVLSCNGIPASQPLADGIKVNESLAAVELDGNNLGVEGGKYMFEAVNGNRGLVAMTLTNTHIGEEEDASIKSILAERRAAQQAEDQARS
mmetsp:Transcript_7244/g.25530  ORF Transcript_7244/g.25530 Transcript_7244/m.25530 type:complete len:353 (-) Transcript_7244:86-1144(-)|eukprot:CAMPEP_0183797874 /NCGR_PEP_ID=MMETSP0803_2-20130417/17360_1 /TAXON_ID=195967 /ORGANISM="Crustomastix stigmata, Strain CCMP3273" /LENGTH=352 /DNA_ID=CAMNT_0026042545 /DNA_START=44 /DNA_END=1102 /DNA_ORIENTATION=-